MDSGVSGYEQEMPILKRMNVRLNQLLSKICYAAILHFRKMYKCTNVQHQAWRRLNRLGKGRVAKIT